MNERIIVKVEGGLVEIVEPLPDGVIVEVRDYDIPQVEDPEEGEWPSDEDGSYAVTFDNSVERP